MGQAAQDLIDGTVDENGEWSDRTFYEMDRQERAEKRQSNAEWSINFLREQGVPFKIVNQSNLHCKVGEYDFFPSTGLYIHQKTKKKGRGVKNLYNLIKNTLGKSTEK